MVLKPIEKLTKIMSGATNKLLGNDRSIIVAVAYPITFLPGPDGMNTGARSVAMLSTGHTVLKLNFILSPISTSKKL
jgi:hypothetical protein